jgi:Ca2+-binding RTX toxin-like protein
MNAVNNPRFKSLAGDHVYARSDLDPTVGADTSGSSLLAAGDNTYRDSNTTPPHWAEYQIVNLFQTFTVESLADPVAGANSFGSDYIAGGTGDDVIFGQLGGDVIQGDGAIDGAVSTSTYVGAARVAAPDILLTPSLTATSVGTLSIVASFETSLDGDDYIEAGGGGDVVFGGLGADDIIGGSSALFTLDQRAERPDGVDFLFGGAGTRIDINTDVTTGDGFFASRHAADADTIVGDNGNVFRLVGAPASLAYPVLNGYLVFNYDANGAAAEGYSTSRRIVVRAVDLLDYTVGGPDFKPAVTTCGNNVASSSDIGGADEVHGESGDDTVYTGCGNDRIFGDSGDDDLIGGWGDDWISGGTGQDGILGDDGRIFTSRSSSGYGEPIYGVAAIPGTLLGTTISTPGRIQEAVIYVAGALMKTVDLTPFNLTDFDQIDNPLDDANQADDILYGGWDDDFVHGGAGDDAILGGEAPALYFAQPTNNGDVLRFGLLRGTEFADYDEFSPRPRLSPFVLDFSSSAGRPVSGASCTGARSADGTVQSPCTDGNDVLFGDLGNDWIVGGTGKDTAWGGWGNDLLNMDDDLSSGGVANEVPDTSSSYEDRAFGGAGLDVLIANTGGDRLIDWIGEFNSYLVPFAPFGEFTVSRQVPPSLYQFLYDLSKAQGADPTRSEDGTAKARNGEPHGEIGLIVQQDGQYWRDQSGAPSDPQPGNIPGGRRDVLRGADFNNGQMQAFAPDSGVWEVKSGALQVGAASQGKDAAAVYYVDRYLPVYYEIQAAVSVQKPTAGWKANAYVIFDYWSPTDFKFAGIDVSNNKIVMGHRTASGWVVDAQSTVPVLIKADITYNVLVAVNGTQVTLVVDGAGVNGASVSFSYTFAPRDLGALLVALNKGLIGFGSDNSRGVLDNIAVQVVPPNSTVDSTEYFEDGTADQFTGAKTGTWSVSGGRYVGASISGATAVSTVDYGVVKPIVQNSRLELEATINTTGTGGVFFDSYAINDLKFVALDVVGQKVLVGHVDPKRGWVVEGSFAAALTVGVDYTINLVLQGTSVVVSLNGSTITTWSYNAAVVDGRIGTISRVGTTSVDRFRYRTDDVAFTGVVLPPEIRVGDATFTEGTGAAPTTATVQLTLSAAVTAATTIGWKTVNGTATAGSDFVGVTSGAVTFAAGSSSATIQVQVAGDAVYEPDEIFSVVLTSWAGFNLADGTGVVTIKNDDVAPIVVLTTTDNAGSEPGTDKLVFAVSRAGDASGTTVVGLTWGGTAIYGGDYLVSVSAGATLSTDGKQLTLAPGTSSVVVTLTPDEDALVELTETVTLALLAGSTYVLGSSTTASGTIVDDDRPTVSIQASASITEGNSGSTTVTLTVMLSAATSSSVSVNYATGGGTATAGTDYVAKSGTLTFAAGATTRTITITVNGDRTKEASETFLVTLSAPANATLTTQSVSTVTIANDDGAPLLAAAAPTSGTAAALTSSVLDPVVEQAKAAWIAARGDADFTGLAISIGALDGLLLGITGVETVTIDVDAAGWGWTVTGGKMDLFTVVLHELGHALGLEHGDVASVMAETLAPGAVHRLGERNAQSPPTPADLRDQRGNWIVGAGAWQTIQAPSGQGIHFIHRTATTQRSPYRLRSGHGARLHRR